jgi:pimeloyl-ACP methyl ester carboxylesterase
VRAAQEVRQDVVLGFWDELMRSQPERLQARVEQVAAAIHVPVLAVFGQQLPDDERDRIRRLVPGVQLEAWPQRGHFVHLAEADRFAARLRAFVDYCDAGRPQAAGSRNPGSSSCDGPSTSR